MKQRRNISVPVEEHSAFDLRLDELKRTGGQKVPIQEGATSALACWRRIPGSTLAEVQANAELALDLLEIYRQADGDFQKDIEGRLGVLAESGEVVNRAAVNKKARNNG